MKVRWTCPAQGDFDRIDSFYAETAPDMADRVGRDAVRAGRFLADYPNAGEVVEKDVRKWSISGSPYLLLYRVTDEAVEVLRVRHRREDWRTPFE
ncbi:type II toxin-antitoxin system RelE/ParE family toxin [Sphingomonas sp. 37zxx]|uniref:type II toxin-antitoxin system RelE/ParE family toxin n=1 Tax=Sphingomonas sp. 37zxx TaxID=1550073 RepID=UPI00053BE0D6|nr:type II toxin-antitoxin system RelE/ParE family toxin [Sphingomonas sp. 37zxx]